MLGVVYYDMLKLNKTITKALCQKQLMSFTGVFKENALLINPDMTKFTFYGTCENVHTQLESPSHLPYTPDVAPSAGHLFPLMGHILSDCCVGRRCEGTKNWGDS